LAASIFLDFGFIITSLTHNAFFTKYGIAGLFANSALSPLVPLPIEITVSALGISGQSLVVIFVVLVIGSIMGDFLAYFIGYGGNKTLMKLHKRVKALNTKRGHALLSKYGWILIFFSPWLPFVGNAIIILAGSRRFSIRNFSFLMISGQVVKAFLTVYLISLVLPYIIQLK
jgi:membrane protein YqaA with SNARE-associated domain